MLAAVLGALISSWLAATCSQVNKAIPDATPVAIQSMVRCFLFLASSDAAAVELAVACRRERVLFLVVFLEEDMGKAGVRSRSKCLNLCDYLELIIITTV